MASCVLAGPDGLSYSRGGAADRCGMELAAAALVGPVARPKDGVEFTKLGMDVDQKYDFPDCPGIRRRCGCAITCFCRHYYGVLAVVAGMG